MADPTAPDYYDQVAQEVRETTDREDAEIEKRVKKLVDRDFQEIQEVIAYEFGWVATRHADMARIEHFILELARNAAEEGKSVMIESHAAREPTGTVLNAVMAGMRLAKQGQK